MLRVQLEGVAGVRSRAIVLAALVALVMPSPVAGGGSGIEFDVDLSATTFQVGDTLTFTPVVTNAEPDEVLRCEIWIERDAGQREWLRMHVSSSGCEPWTFVVPPGPLGQYVVGGRVYIGLVEGQPTEHREVIQNVTFLAGGTPAPFVTNYPVQSWALDDIVSTPTPTFGEPMSIYPPATGDTCIFRTFGGLEVSYVWQRDGCIPWTFTIPERDSQGPGTIFGDATDVMIMSWIGESPYTIDPEGGFMGQMFGETYVVTLPAWASGDSDVTEYASNLPAIFAGPQRGWVGLAGDPTPIVIAPVVVGTTEGACVYSNAPGTTPVVAGGCQDPVIVPGSFGPGTNQGGAQLELRDSEGTVLSTGNLWVGWVDEMPSLDVEAPEFVSPDQPTDIDASTEDGAPATYEVIAEPEIEGAAGVGGGAAVAGGGGGGAIVIASGALDPDLQSDGDAIEVTHAFGTPGRYRVTATFTDVRGITSTGSTVIHVGVDKTDPTTTKPKNAFASNAAKWDGKIPVRFTWTGSDTGSGVDRYVAAISKDGGAYSVISNSLPSPALTRYLPAGHTYRLRVRAVDNAGNVGPWVAGSIFRLKAFQDSSASIDRDGGWSTSTNANYWGGTERLATNAGAKAKLTFTGRSFAWIGSVGPSRGSAKVYVDGNLVETVSLYSPTTSHRHVLVDLSWGSSASRTIKIVVVGTAGHPRVNIDALVTGT
jgi:hypothetical protein